jgi:hypothetical protein
MRFQLNDRVRVSPTYHWAQGAMGTISEPPEFLRLVSQTDYPWEGYHRFVKGREGPIEFFWVLFDEPQNDADGDGPYKGGEIDVNELSMGDVS